MYNLFFALLLAFSMTLAGVVCKAQSIGDFFKKEREASIESVLRDLNDLLLGIELHRDTEGELRRKGAKDVPTGLWLTKHEETLISLYTVNTIYCVEAAKTESDLVKFQDLIKAAQVDVERLRGIAVCKAALEFQYRGYGTYPDWNKICTDWKLAIKKGFDVAELTCDKLRIAASKKPPAASPQKTP